MGKVGMVLEGGGLRGLYTAGVLDVLLANDINIDAIIGTSAGALFGVNYFSEQRGRALRYNKEYCALYDINLCIRYKLFLNQPSLSL